MFNDCIYFNLSTLSRRITKIWHDEFSLIGLSPSHGYLLTAIVSNPSASQKELSETMELDSSTITRFIDALDAKKMIKKTSVGKGARVEVTERGFETVNKIEQHMNELVGNIQDVFGKQEFKDFIKHLQKARQTLDEV